MFLADFDLKNSNRKELTWVTLFLVIWFWLIYIMNFFGKTKHFVTKILIYLCIFNKRLCIAASFLLIISSWIVMYVKIPRMPTKKNQNSIKLTSIRVTNFQQMLHHLKSIPRPVLVLMNYLIAEVLLYLISFL